MTTATSSITAEDIGQRVLKLIDSIRSADDIAPTQIEKVTGIKVDFNPADQNQYGFGGKLSDTWSYNLVSLTEADGSKPTRLMFSFDEQNHDDDADMSAICGLDFDAYAKALKQAGFKSEPAPGERNSTRYWDFSRGEVSVHVYVRGESDAKAGHTCVTSLIINA